MSLNFEKHAAKGNEFVNLLAGKLAHGTDRERAGRVVRSILRVMRDRLSYAESLQLMAQLPMALKAVYVDGWKPSGHRSKIKNMDSFASAIMKEDGLASHKDFPNKEAVISATRAFIETLALFVSRNELEEAFGTLPASLNSTFVSWLPAGKHV